MVSSTRASKYETQKSIKMSSKKNSSFSILRYFLHLAFVLWWIFCIGYSISLDSSLITSGDTVWIVDTSLSMCIEDMEWDRKTAIESRFTIAKSIIKKWISEIPWKHAVVVYAENAGIASPFSSDIFHLSEVVDNLNIVENYGWSDLSSALSLVKNIYFLSGISPHIYVLTDGGLTGGSVFPDIQGSNITLIALWSEVGGKIPLGYNAQGERRYKYFEGKEIIIPLDQVNIDTIRQKYNTSLFHVTGLRNSFDFLSEKKSIVFSYNFWRILGILITIIGFLIHPYVRRKS